LRLLLNKARQLPWLDGLEADAKRVRWLIQSDVEQFRLALGQANLTETVALYQRPLLQGWPSIGISSYEAWLELERENLHKAWREAVLKHATHLRQQAHFNEAKDLLKRLFDDDPLSEEVLQQYLETFYLLGKRDEALEVYEHFAGQLKEELDLEPLPETRRLIEQIREAKPLELTPVQTKPSVPLQVMRPPTLIGRSRQARAVQTSKSHVVLVAGEAGVGKSRLLAECLSKARWLKCREGLQNLPYFPLTEAMQKCVINVPELGDYSEDLARLMPSLFPALKPAPADPQTAKPRLLEALALVFEADTTPLVLDDLQWADGATLEWLLFMASRGKLRLYGSYRSTEVSETLAASLSSLRSANWLTVIELEPLDAQAVTQLLGQLSGSDEGPPLFSNWLYTLSAGNPFFLLETLTSLFETGQLWIEDGAWCSHLDHVTKDYSEFAIPPVIAQVIKNRLERLPESVRRVLEVASVVREDMNPTLLAAMTGLSDWVVTQGLADAEAAGLLRATSFAHDLVRQTLYRAMPLTRRRFLHKKVAEVLEDNATPLVVAEHWFEAGEVEKAARHWLNVALHYDGAGLFHEAKSLLERIIQVAPKTIFKHRAQATLAEHYRLWAQPEEAEKLVAEVLRETQDTWALAYVYLVQAELYLHRGQLSEAEVAASQAAHFAKSHDDAEFYFDVTLVQAVVAQAKGAYQTSLDLSLGLLEKERQRGPSHKLAVLLTKVGSDYSCVGRYEESLACYQESLEMARRLGARRQQVLCVSNIMSVYLYMNREREGLALAHEALGWGQFDATYTLRYYLARAYLKAARYQDALLEADIVQREFNSSRFRCGALLCLAEAHHYLGNEAEKASAFDEAIAIAEASDVPQTRSWVIISVLKYANAEQVRRIQALIESLEMKLLPYYLLSDVKEALALNHSEKALA
jgi:tetratricopeptide (TPR) repeat protein